MLDLITRIFDCQHRRTTFPQSTKDRPDIHVTCLTCGREFDYDWATMTMGEPAKSLRPKHWKDGTVQPLDVKR